MKFWRRACTFLIIFVLVFQLCGCAALERSYSPGRANVSPLVEQWRDEVVLVASELGLEAYVELILAMIAQESCGDSTRHPDIMQSSESAGLAPNSITDPMESIRQGMRYFSGLLEKGKTAGVCEKTVLQSYNFGAGYINYIKNNYDGVHSEASASAFSRAMAQRLGWSNYGDVKYVEHVYSHMFVGGADFNLMQTVMAEYEGVPYLFGGDSKIGIDCSAMSRRIYQAAGITLPRTAQEQYNITTHIDYSQAMPGDLVFFTGTYNAGRYITHVGVYVGDNIFFHAGGSRCQYSSLTGYYLEHFVCFGRKG